MASDRDDDNKLRVGSFSVHAARGIVRDRGTRRRAMLILLASALVMLLAGSTVLSDALAPRDHAVRYLLFWCACAWLTGATLLLGVYDALIVRREGRAARRVLREQIGRGTGRDIDSES